MRALPIALAALPREGSARAWLAERSDGARLHAGIDLGRQGNDVKAPEAGIVWGVIDASYASDEPRYSHPGGWAGYGPRVVVLEGDSGAWHVLAHVDEPAVRVGERVGIGQRIAVVADRGNHLHWEVRSRTKPPRGMATVEVALDPVAWVAGRIQVWSRAVHGCPPNPGETTRTPTACRPGAREVPPVPGRVEPTAPVLRLPARTPAPAPRGRAGPNPTRPRRPRARLAGRDGRGGVAQRSGV